MYTEQSCVCETEVHTFYSTITSEYNIIWIVLTYSIFLLNSDRLIAICVRLNTGTNGFL